MEWIKEHIIKRILLNIWTYITIFVIYFVIYGETKNQPRYVLMLQESTGNIYHARLIDPVYQSYVDKYNIFDSDDMFSMKSYNTKFIHYIGNIHKELLVDNQIGFTSLTVVPNRKYVTFSLLPELIKKPVAPEDIYDVDLVGLESKGLTNLKMIVGDSAESLENSLKERSDTFKQQNPPKKQ